MPLVPLEKVSRMVFLRLDQLADQPPHIIGCEAEVWKQILDLSRGAKAIDAQYPALQSDIFPPAESRPRLDGDASLHSFRQNAFPVRLVLRVEYRGARH